MGHDNSESMAERIVWTLALATASAVATAAATKGMTALWRHLRGTNPPHGVAGISALGAGLGRKAARHLHL